MAATLCCASARQRPSAAEGWGLPNAGPTYGQAAAPSLKQPVAVSATSTSDASARGYMPLGRIVSQLVGTWHDEARRIDPSAYHKGRKKAERDAKAAQKEAERIPEGWEEHVSRSNGDTYWLNVETGEGVDKQCSYTSLLDSTGTMGCFSEIDCLRRLQASRHTIGQAVTAVTVA